MKIKKFIAKDTKQALTMIRDTLGPDAYVISNKTVQDGVEVLATLDVPESNFENKNQLLNQKILTKPQILDVDINEKKPIEELKSEFSLLKSLVQEQLSDLIWREKEKRNPIEAFAIRYLLSRGFAPEIVENLVSGLDINLKEKAIWPILKRNIQDRLIINTPSLDTFSGIYVFVGASGVGKTESIAKIATQYAMRFDKERLALVNCDLKRVGARDHLNTYAKILDVSYRKVNTQYELDLALNNYQNKSLILIDTPSVNLLKKDALKEQLNIFANEPVRYIFVSNANIEFKTLQAYINNLIHFNLDIATSIVTKVDETVSMGPALSAYLNSHIPLGLYSDGASVPDSLHLFDLNKILMGLDKEDMSGNLAEFSDEQVARMIAGVQR